jgi:hypothetical protein
MSRRSLNGIESDDVRSLNGLSVHKNMLKKLKATQPLEYDADTFTYSLKGLNGFTANKFLRVNPAGNGLIYSDDNNTEYTGTAPIDITGTTISLKGLSGFTANKFLRVNPAGDGLIYSDDNDTNYWNLNSSTLTPKLDSYNVIIGNEDATNSNNVELLVYGDMELKNTLFSTNNNENKIDFDTTYGIDFYGYYYSPSLRSYNVSFRNNTHGSYFPYLGVSNTGDFLFHINGRGDTMIMKADATRDVLITAGDLIGSTSSNYTKNRMKDIYCRNIYAEPIEIKNGSTSSGYINLYENSTNGSGFAKLQAPASLASDITATLPSTTGTLLNTAQNQTLNYPLFTKTTGNNPIFAMRDEDLSNWIYMKTPEVSSDITLTFPSTTGTLALQSEIRTDAQIRGLFSGTPPISVSASGVISTSFTPTSTETMENKTLKSPIFTSTSGAYEKMILKDENLSHNINIFTPDLTGNINIGFPSVTGTLAITDDIPNTTDIRALFSSAGNPITYSNGVIGWTNSENYITNADVLSQIASATSISTSSILGNPSRTFGNSLCDNIINGTSTTINNCILTGTSGDNARLTLKDNNLDHNAIIKCLNFSEDRTFYLDDGGTFLTSGASSTSSIRGLFSGTPPVSLNTSTGVISMSLDNVVSYSSTAPSAISFGNATNLRDITMNTSEFLISSNTKNVDCILTIKSDTDNDDESSNPILKFNQDGDIVKAVIQLGNNDMYIQHQYAGDATTKLRLGAYNEEQLHLYHDTADIFGSLNVLPTTTSGIYIAKFLASSLANANLLQFVIGKSTATNNCGSLIFDYKSDGSTTNNFQLGLSGGGKEDMLQLKADTNIIMNSNKVDIITPNGTDDCNLILSAGNNGGAGNSPIIVLQNTNSAGTIKKAQLFLNGADDYLVLKNLVTTGRIELVVGSTVLGIFNTSQSEITNTTVIGSNRFKVKHDNGFNFISNPEGTQFDDDTKAGSHITYHDNGTEMTFNCPNSTYRYTNSSNHRFQFNGGTRFGIFGSSNPCIQMTKTTGANFNKQGFATTFPTEIGEWSSQTVPIDGAFYIGGQSTNDSEGYFLCMNGQTAAFSSPGDNYTLWWLDEDGAPAISGWRISTAGAISTVSDSRTKTNVKTYKNSNFEKYKKIRTITYTKKIPKDINPKRLEKQSCINKYNDIHYGVIAEELYDLYPEIENTTDIRKRDEWNYRKDNWNNGIYEKELDEWKEKKNNYDKEKGKDDKEEFKTKQPNKDFDEEMPYKVVDYERINIISVGVIQDLIKQNEKQQEQIQGMASQINYLLSKLK